MTSALLDAPPRDETLYDPEDLLALPDGKQYELIDGRLMERSMGFRANRITNALNAALYLHCVQQRLGWVMPPDTSYHCFPQRPKLVRRPDISFVTKERLPLDQEPEGHCRIAPDLVVEVISPNDEYYDVEERVRDYRAAGVRLIWLVVPPSRLVLIRRLDGTAAEVGEAGELDGENVVPGFRCLVADIFRPPFAPTNGAA